MSDMPEITDEIPDGEVEAEPDHVAVDEQGELEDDQ